MTLPFIRQDTDSRTQKPVIPVGTLHQTFWDPCASRMRFYGSARGMPPACPREPHVRRYTPPPSPDDFPRFPATATPSLGNGGGGNCPVRVATSVIIARASRGHSQNAKVNADSSKNRLVLVRSVAVRILSFPRSAWERKCFDAPRRLPKDAERPWLAFRRRASEREESRVWTTARCSQQWALAH
jgi:hypothetical protein